MPALELYDDCDKWRDGKNPIWVGGTLINYSTQYLSNPIKGFNAYYYHTLVFQGISETCNIYIATTNETIPYEISQFYKFDIGNMCRRIYSMMSSGIYDGEFEPLNCGHD